MQQYYADSTLLQYGPPPGAGPSTSYQQLNPLPPIDEFGLPMGYGPAMDTQAHGAPQPPPQPVDDGQPLEQLTDEDVSNYLKFWY